MNEATTQAVRGVLEEAAAIYEERNAKRGDLWKVRGWRGCLFDLRVCAERAWASLFHAEPGVVEITTFQDEEPRYATGEDHNVDELLDAINYAAMAVVAVREGNRGDRWWDG